MQGFFEFKYADHYKCAYEDKNDSAFLDACQTRDPVACSVSSVYVSSFYHL